MQYQQRTLSSSDGQTPIAVHIWQSTDDSSPQKTLWCAHGLTRSGLDFLPLAEYWTSQQSIRIIAHDTVGRGQSGWLDDKSQYHLDRYAQDILLLFKDLGVNSCDWLGTSMGGLLAMRLLSLGEQRIERLILNDVGPEIEATGMSRILGYLGREFHFADWNQALAHHKTIFAPFGDLTEEQWTALARAVLQPTDSGFRYCYDPAITQGKAPWPAGGDLWKCWESIQVPTLILRGAHSDILSMTTVEKMMAHNPHSQAHIYDDVGHAATFCRPQETDILMEWLALPAPV